MTPLLEYVGSVFPSLRQIGTVEGLSLVQPYHGRKVLRVFSHCSNLCLGFIIHIFNCFNVSHEYTSKIKTSSDDLTSNFILCLFQVLQNITASNFQADNFFEFHTIAAWSNPWRASFYLSILQKLGSSLFRICYSLNKFHASRMQLFSLSFF